MSEVENLSACFPICFVQTEFYIIIQVLEVALEISFSIISSFYSHFCLSFLLVQYTFCTLYKENI